MVPQLTQTLDIQPPLLPLVPDKHGLTSNVPRTHSWRLYTMGEIASQTRNNGAARRFKVYTGAVVELTIEQVLSDPMIELVNVADGVNSHTFAQLMQSAARVLERRAK